jgi:hypothetical protein
MGLSSKNMKTQRVLEISITTANGAQTGNVTAIGYRHMGLSDSSNAIGFVASAAGLVQDVELGEASPEGVTLLRFNFTIGA